MKDKEERRKYPRIPKIFLVSITHGGLKESVPALMVDISLGGMKALTKNVIDRAKEIILTIISCDGETVEVPAEAIWCQKMDIMSEFSVGVDYINGFEFRIPPEKVKERIFDRFGIVDFLGWTDDICDSLQKKSKGSRKK